MKLNFLKILSFLLLLHGQTSFAGSVDLNLFYFSDNLVSSSTTGTTDTFFDISGMMNIDKKGHYRVGWSYASFSVATTATTTTAYAATEMGPRFGWVFDKDNSWGVFLTYNLQTEATYTTTAAEKWRGTSLKAEVGYTPAVTESIHVGLKFIYYSATYTEKLVGTSTFSTVSYSRAFLYPAIAVSMVF